MIFRMFCSPPAGRQFFQKLTYTALGGLLMLVGMLFSSISPLTAQKDVFGDITCTSLAVVDKDGKSRVRLFINEDGGKVDVSGKDGGEVKLGISEDGGAVTVSGSGKDGGFGSLFINENGGFVTVIGKDWKGSGFFGTNEDGGFVDVFGNYRDKVKLGISEDGGFVTVFGKGGSGILHTDKHGGEVMVHGKDNNSIVTLRIKEDGGYVNVASNDLKSQAYLSATENGGAVHISGLGESGATLGIHKDGGFVIISDKYGNYTHTGGIR